MIPFVPAYTITLGEWLMPALVVVTAGLCWLALWLLGKGGWRSLLGWALVAVIVLLAISMVVR